MFVEPFKDPFTFPFVDGPAVEATLAEKITAYSPLIWWKLDESSGTVANDSGSAGTDGTVTLGSGSWGATGLSDLTCLDFVSSRDCTITKTATLAYPTAGTFAVFRKLSSAQMTDGLFHSIRFSDLANNQLILQKTNSNVLTFTHQGGGGTTRTITLSAINTGDWFLEAGTWDGSGTAHYAIDTSGTVLASNTGAASGTPGSANSLHQMGYAGFQLKGLHQHMMILPSKLTQAELQTLATI